MNEPAPDPNAGLWELPKVRYSMQVLTATGGAVVVTEQRQNVKLTVNDGTLERSVTLTILEARKVSDHLNRICRRVTARPEGRP